MIVVRILAVLGMVLGAIGIALFWVQNSTRATQLSLDVGFAAWQLQQPVSIPALLAVCFAAGLVCGLATLGVRGLWRRNPSPGPHAPGTDSGSW